MPARTGRPSKQTVQARARLAPAAPARLRALPRLLRRRAPARASGSQPGQHCPWQDACRLRWAHQHGGIRPARRLRQRPFEPGKEGRVVERPLGGLIPVPAQLQRGPQDACTCGRDTLRTCWRVRCWDACGGGGYRRKLRCTVHGGDSDVCERRHVPAAPRPLPFFERQGVRDCQPVAVHLKVRGAVGGHEQHLQQQGNAPRFCQGAAQRASSVGGGRGEEAQCRRPSQGWHLQGGAGQHDRHCSVHRDQLHKRVRLLATGHHPQAGCSAPHDQVEISQALRSIDVGDQGLPTPQLVLLCRRCRQHAALRTFQFVNGKCGN